MWMYLQEYDNNISPPFAKSPSVCPSESQQCEVIIVERCCQGLPHEVDKVSVPNNV